MVILGLLGLSPEQVLGKGLYIGMLFLLLLASLGAPIPEDIPLLLGGAIARADNKDLIAVIVVGLIGVLSGDIVLYCAGRRFGMDVVTRWPFRVILTQTHIEKMKEQFRKRGNWIIFFGRFFAGIRSVMCVTAGMSKVQAWKFILIDMTGALITVPFLVLAGWWFSSNINHLIQGVGVLERIIGAVVVVIVIGWVIYIHWSKRSRIRQVEKATKAELKATAEVKDENFNHEPKED
jgi:membrane protein DedA with SNARE-associated domain